MNSQYFADSILNEIAKEKKQEKKIERFIILIQFYLTNNTDKSLQLCDTAIAICKKQKLKEYELLVNMEKARVLLSMGAYDKTSDLLFAMEQEIKPMKNDKLLGRFYLIKNLAYIYSGDFSKAMDFSLKAILHANLVQDSITLSKAYNNVGVVYDYTNNSQKAIENYLISKTYASGIKDNALLSVLDNNIGVIYDKLGNKEKALKYYYKSLEYCNSINDLNGISTAFNNIAAILSSMNRTAESMAYYKKALILSRQSQNQANIALLEYNIGSVFINLSKYDSAEIFLNNSLAFYENSKDDHSISEIYSTLGSMHYKLGKYALAKSNYQKSINYAQKSGVLLIQEQGFKNISEIFAKRKEFEAAYEYQKRAMELSDSIREQNKIEEIRYSDFQIKFKKQSSKFEMQLKEHDQSHKEELNKQKTEKYLVAVLLLLIIVIALIIYRSFVKSRHKNDKLLGQKREIESQKALIEISNIELREQYVFTETLLNTIPNPVFYTDKNSKILGCNKAFEDVLGKSIDELMGLSLNDLEFSKDLSCNAKQILDEPNNSLIRTDGIIKFSDNSLHDVICYRKGIIDVKKKLVGILGIIIDITDIKDAEKQLKFSQTRLKEALNAKDKFFNIMAHDLKNPFNAILGLTQIISNDFENHSEAELKQYTGLINQSATQIYNLLENLLEWARAQSGSIEKNPSIFVINQIINDSISLFKNSIDQKNIIIIANFIKEYEVHADKNMMMTVLRNLLSNAIKFTPNSGEIRIEIQENQEFIEVSIVDNGIGIDSDKIERLFKIDQPVSTPGLENEKGTGLGLIICKEFVKQNGGIIAVKPNKNKGVKFTFSIPKSKS